MPTKQLKKRLKISFLAAAGALAAALAARYVLGMPGVRLSLAPLHDGVWLPVMGWIAGGAPISHLLLATAAVVSLTLWVGWILGARSFRGILELLLTSTMRFDPRSRLFRRALSWKGRLYRRLRWRGACRPGWLSRSYLQALRAAIGEEERRFHAAGGEALRRSLSARLEGRADLHLAPGVDPDGWALRQALIALEESAALGGDCAARLAEVARQGLEAMLPPERRRDERGAVAVSALFQAVSAPSRSADLTFLYLCLLSEHRREPEPGLAAAIRSRLEDHGQRLLRLARSLAAGSALPPGEAREQRREAARLAEGAALTLDLFALAPAYCRLLLRMGDGPGVRYWVALLEELAALSAAFRARRDAAGIRLRLLHDDGAGRLRPWRAPAPVRAALLRADESWGTSGDRIEEARFALACP